MRFCMRGMTYVALAALLGSVLVMGGCSSGDDATLFLNVSERPAWGPDGRLALAAWGGNEIRYVYSVLEGGGGLTLLTLADRTDDWSEEGGWHPAYRPDDGNLIAFAGRRSGVSPREAIYRMDAEEGDRRTAAALITASATAGADMMPSWKPDAGGLVFVTTEYTGTRDLATVSADGSGRARLALEAGAFDWDNAEMLWPVYTPDGNQIVFECRAVGSNRSDIWIHNTETGSTTNLTQSNFDDGAPAVQPVAGGGAPKILFHSNRNGEKYDLWVMNIDGTDARTVTQTNRSDGYPVWSPDGDRVAFLRDRELWTMRWTDVEAERDYTRLTRRFR